MGADERRDTRRARRHHALLVLLPALRRRLRGADAPIRTARLRDDAAREGPRYADRRRLQPRLSLRRGRPALHDGGQPVFHRLDVRRLRSALRLVPYEKIPRLARHGLRRALPRGAMRPDARRELPREPRRRAFRLRHALHHGLHPARRKIRRGRGRLRPSVLAGRGHDDMLRSLRARLRARARGNRTRGVARRDLRGHDRLRADARPPDRGAEIHKPDARRDTALHLRHLRQPARRRPHRRADDLAHLHSLRAHLRGRNNSGSRPRAEEEKIGTIILISEYSHKIVFV